MPNVKKFTLAISLTFFPINSIIADDVTETYDYDPLGRLRIVNSDSNSKIEYCYDKAGNRVAVGGSGTSDNCATGNEPPPAPTGLSKQSVYGVAWVASWSLSEGATSYKLKFGSSFYPEFSGTVSSYNHGNINEPPVWIRACNDNGCSTRVYF